MCGLRSSVLSRGQRAQFSRIHLCLPLTPGRRYCGFPPSFSSTFCGKDTYTFTLHTLFLSLSLTFTHPTRRLHIYINQHFQIFVFEVMYVCFSCRCGRRQYIMHFYLYSILLLYLHINYIFPYFSMFF